MVLKNYKLLFLGLLFISAGVNAQDTTALLCQGSGSVLESKVSNGIQYDEKAHSYTKTTSTSTTDHRSFSGSANIEISGNSVRIKLPHELVPPLNKAQDGWFTLENTFVGDKEISGVLHLNAFNKPKVHIDRVTGQLSLSSGFQDFNGSCNRIDYSLGPKF